MQNKIIYLMTVLILMSFSVWAGGTESEQLELDDVLELSLNDLMDIDVSIATKYKLPISKVPGTVTVLKGDDLEKRGIRTVSEALGLVPGLHFSVSGNGGVRITMRGIPTGDSNKIKFMLNDVPMNASLTGEAAPLFYIPIEQVERIEIIRGPGSALYGKWAYLGVINVITRQDGNRVFGRFGSFDAHNAGVVATYNDIEDFKVNLNVSGWERDRSDIGSGPDSFTGSGLSSNAPGPVNDSRETGTGVLSMEYKDLSLIAQWTSTDFGSHYGMLGALPPLDDRQNQTERTWMVEMCWDRELSQALELKLNAGYRRYLYDSGKMWPLPAGVITTDGPVANLHYEEGAAYAGLNLHWTEWERHHILFGLEYENVGIGDTWWELNYDPVTFGPVAYQRFSGDKNWLDEHNSRNIFGAFIQDEYRITDNLTLTAGLRYDVYDDTKNTNKRGSIRIAGVYSVSENHIFEIQYAEAFRPPSFLEMYVINGSGLITSAQLDFETVKTYELGYIYKNTYLTGGLTLFHSEMNDLIEYGVNPATSLETPDNVDTIKSRGIEMTLNWKICNSFLIDANVSYANTVEGETLLGEINWLGNVGLVYQPDSSNRFASLNYGYVGKRKRIDEDTRVGLDAYNTVDITAGIEKLFFDGIEFRAGVKNIFDEDIRFPADHTSFPEDYEYPGREWWVGFTFEF